MYPPTTGRDEALAAVLSSDWLSGLPHSYLTTGTEWGDKTWTSSRHEDRQRKAVRVGVKALVFCCTCVLTELTFMAKRRAEDTLLHDSPSKRYFRSLCSVDMQLGSMPPTGDVSPPSLLALLGSRARKRPYYFEDPDKQQEEEETSLHRKATRCDTRKHAANVLTEQTSGSFQGRRSSSSALTSSKKRPRDDCGGSETVVPKEKDKVSHW